MSCKLKLQDIKDLADKANKIFLDVSYVDNKYKHSWKCKKCNYIWKTALVNIKFKKSNCPKCAGQVVDISDLSDYAVLKKGKLLGPTPYKNNKTKLKWQCEKKHTWKASWSNVKAGKWCPICAKNQRLTKLDIKNRIIPDYIVTSSYKNAHIKIELICKKGHKWNTTYSNFKKGNRCPKCSNNGTSKAELELVNIFKQYGLQVINSYKPDFMEGKELDIFFPEKNIAIEYCGLYWHHDGRLDRNYHNNKRLKCEANGIRLITIFEDEWESRRPQVLNFLKATLGVNHTNVYARKCKIQEITKPQVTKFLNDNHIQGGQVQIKIAFGLFYENELVGAITGAMHHRGSDVFVLNRLAFKDGYAITGGTSRLLKKLMNYAKLNNIDKIISWSDNRWSQGAVYKQTGFTLEGNLPIAYSYIEVNNPRYRLSKQSCKKPILLKRGGTGDTEGEMASSLGYSRIWDCGKIRWSISI